MDYINGEVLTMAKQIESGSMRRVRFGKMCLSNEQT